MMLSSPEPASNTTGTGADPRQDPAMRSLYRMSRTAGVGLQDYAAVNVFAVVGLLLALADGPAHGYAIGKDIEDRTGGRLDPATARRLTRAASSSR